MSERASQAAESLVHPWHHCASQGMDASLTSWHAEICQVQQRQQQQPENWARGSAGKSALGQSFTRNVRRISVRGANAVASTRVRGWGTNHRMATVRLPDWSESVASYSRMKSAWGWANGGQPILVCYIRKYVIILGGYSRWRLPNQNIGGICPRHPRRGWRQWANAPVPPEAKKILKSWLRNGAFWSTSE